MKKEAIVCRAVYSEKMRRRAAAAPRTQNTEKRGGAPLGRVPSFFTIKAA